MKRCHCGGYVPASERRAGRDQCLSCKRETERVRAHYAKVNDVIDAIDAANDVAAVNSVPAARGAR